MVFEFRAKLTLINFAQMKSTAAVSTGADMCLAGLIQSKNMSQGNKNEPEDQSFHIQTSNDHIKMSLVIKTQLGCDLRRHYITKCASDL